MNVPAQTKPAGLVATMAARYSMDVDKFTRVINATVMGNAPNVTDEQIAAFLMVAYEYGLNPFLKQIHCYPSKGGGVVPIISIDGWCQMVLNHPAYNGKSFQDHFDADGKIYAVTCTMHRKDVDHPEVVTEYLSENYRNTDNWRTMPNRMLRHRALIQCARYAFGLSGAFDEGHHIIDVDVGEGDINLEPIQRQVAPPTKRTPPPAPNGKKDEPAHDPETGEIFDGETFLTDLDGALASAKDKDELQTIWADHEPQANLFNDKERYQRAKDLLAWHSERLAKGFKS